MCTSREWWSKNRLQSLPEKQVERKRAWLCVMFCRCSASCVCQFTCAHLVSHLNETSDRWTGAQINEIMNLSLPVTVSHWLFQSSRHLVAEWKKAQCAVRKYRILSSGEKGTTVHERNIKMYVHQNGQGTATVDKVQWAIIFNMMCFE